MNLILFSFNKAFYPSGSNWRGNISGSMERLRALELATIKNYHSTYYQPQNLCLIVAGRLSTSKLIAELQSAIEPQLISRRRDIDMKGKYPFESWKRPFFDTEGSSIPNLEDKSVDVEYPSQQSKFGAVRIVFPHPSRPDAVIETVRDFSS
jgi:Zn-dependent M16 (insulinase) family peptidase